MKQRKKQHSDTVNEESLNKQMNESQDEQKNEVDQSTFTENENGGNIESKLNEELDTLQKKLDESNDKYLRLYSEFDNFRKRAIKERIELSKTAAEQIITDFLTILDDFERAISSFGTVETIEPVKEGTILIYNKFRNSLVQKGLNEIDANGSNFDTDYHEAIANIPAPTDNQKGKVIEVTQKGYTLNGKVIRFAKVVVGN